VRRNPGKPEKESRPNESKIQSGRMGKKPSIPRMIEALGQKKRNEE